MYEQLYSWTFEFRKVVRQHIWGEVANFIPSSAQNAKVKELLKSILVRQSYHKKIACVFLTHDVYAKFPFKFK